MFFFFNGLFIALKLSSYPQGSHNNQSRTNQSWGPGFDLWVGKIAWRKARQPTLVFFCFFNSHCILFYFFFPFIFISWRLITNSSILNWRIPMDRGAWWATINWVTRSQTWLRNSAAQSQPIFSVLTCVHYAQDTLVVSIPRELYLMILSP